MNKIPLEIKQKTLRILTTIVFIYPILPLLLICFWAIAVFGISPLIELKTFTNLKINTVINWFALMIWLFGGIAGMVGLAQILSNKRTLTSLLLIIYGAISYTIVVFFFTVGGLLNTGNHLFMAHSTYLVLTLGVIAIQITITVKEVLKNRRFVRA